MSLTANQKKWIYEKTNNFVRKWIDCKMEDHDWLQMIDESKRIAEKSRNDKTTIDILVSFVLFKENVEKVR